MNNRTDNDDLKELEVAEVTFTSICVYSRRNLGGTADVECLSEVRLERSSPLAFPNQGLCNRISYRDSKRVVMRVKCRSSYVSGLSA